MAVKPRRPAFFGGYWFDEKGQRIRRVHRSEMREVWRLWREHKDIRTGQAR